MRLFRGCLNEGSGASVCGLEIVDEIVLLVEACLEAGYAEVVEVEGNAYAAVGLQEGPGRARCLIAVDGMEHEVGAGSGLAEQEADEVGVQ